MTMTMTADRNALVMSEQQEARADEEDALMLLIDELS
jgi:hypothetical protein